MTERPLGDEMTASEHDDWLVDEMSDESFPDSDPPSTWAGADRRPVSQEDDSL